MAITGSGGSFFFIDIFLRQCLLFYSDTRVIGIDLMYGKFGFLHLQDRHFEGREIDAMNCHPVSLLSIIFREKASHPSALSKQFLLPVEVSDHMIA